MKHELSINLYISFFKEAGSMMYEKDGQEIPVGLGQKTKDEPKVEGGTDDSGNGNVKDGQ